MEKTLGELGRDVVPSITKQTKWPVKFVDFGRAKTPENRFFNSTIIRRREGEWLIARRATGTKHNGIGDNSLVAFLLDANRNPSHYAEINLANRSYRNQHFEDPRITTMNGQVWLSYCTFQIIQNAGYTGAQQQVAILNDEWNPISTWSPIYGFNGGSILTGSGNEKNWTWFEHDGAPHLLYNIEPQTVVRWEGEFVKEEWSRPTAPWKYGHMRGGTPPVQFEPGGDYTVFFHSSTPWTEKKRRYYMGAYQFSPRPPFQITRITRKPILTGSREDPWHPGLPLVVFPCGAIVSNDNWIISMGVNDHLTALMELPHADLLKLLFPPDKLT